MIIFKKAICSWQIIWWLSDDHEVEGSECGDKNDS